MKNLLIATTALALMGSAHGEWLYIKNVDDWDNSVSEMSFVFKNTENGRWTFSFMKAGGGQVAGLDYKPSGLNILCQFGESRIQAKIDGQEVDMGYWSARNNSYLLLNPRELYEKASKGNTLRVRLYDGCDNRHDMAFDITGQPRVNFTYSD